MSAVEVRVGAVRDLDVSSGVQPVGDVRIKALFRDPDARLRRVFWGRSDLQDVVSRVLLFVMLLLGALRSKTIKRDTQPMPVVGRARGITRSAVVAVIACALSQAFVLCAPSGAEVVVGATTSYFEQSANAHALYLQGESAGRGAEQGIVILDFGRPATIGVTDGTIVFGHGFVSFDAIELAVESYIVSYFSYAPSLTRLDVAIGTNNSCGAGQPCGGVICGCIDEPQSYTNWGADLARTVEALEVWVEQEKAAGNFSDTVNVIAADDAEPAYDPDYLNTDALLSGYADAVGGSSPAMVDYGSAETGYWSERQLWQVAFGFAPDVPMPEIYGATQEHDWALLMSYAKKTGRHLSIFGVLTDSSNSSASGMAYQEMCQVVAAINGQSSIPWQSSIQP